MATSEQTLLYNAKDAVSTFVIARRVMEEVQQLHLEKTYQHTIDLYGPLIYMMLRGVRVDQEALTKMKGKVQATMLEYQDRLNKLVGHPLNFNSSDQVKKYFYIEKGVPAYTKYNKKSGGSTVTVDDKALQRLSRPTSNRKGFEEAKIIQRLRQLSKLKGTYLEITFDADQRLRCSYNPRGTRFGRLSSSKTIFETGMNMQNLPPAFQHFLVADPGRLFFSLDKSQAEWVVVAYASGDAAMIHAVESGLDVHAYTASNMFKVPIEIVKMEHKDLGHMSDPDQIVHARAQLDYMSPYLRLWLPRSMSMRQCGKKSNHGLNYDETEKMFSLINEISEKEAGIIIEFYHGIYRGIRKWHEAIRNQLAQDRTLINPFGRRQNFMDKWGPDLWKSAYSFIPQSTVGELVNRGMDDIYEDNSEDTTDLEIMMQVHDSVDFQFPDNDAKRMVRAIRFCVNKLNPTMELNGREFTIGTDLKVGYNLGEMHEINLKLTDGELAERIQEIVDGKEKAQ